MTMNIKYKFWVSSFRNISFDYEEDITLDDLGYEENEWSELSDSEKEAELEAFCMQLLLNNYVEYGYREIKQSHS